jgi:iron complex outermembrane receptor protein
VHRDALLLGLLAAAAPTALYAQSAAPTPARTPVPSDPAAGDEVSVEEVVVSGQRPRGAVVGDIAPEQTFTAAEIRSFGVSSINDLLSEVSPETTSGRGGAPVVLLNGRRISGPGELRDIPTEAIQRMEILPEEVALKYGYAANQKVVNIVLRRRFRATTTQAGVGGPTAGRQVTPAAEASLLRLDRNGRLNLGVKYQRSDRLLESDRDLAPAIGGAPYDRLSNVTATSPGAEIDPALSALAG